MMKGIIYQSAAVLILSIPNYLASVIITWPSYTGKLLESSTSPIGVTLTRSQLELVASFPVLGSLIAIATCRLPDAIGRKNSEILSGIVTALGWSLIITAHSVTQLLIGRLCLGMGVGIHLLIFVVYINEFSQAFIRGTMACIPFFFFSLGTLISYVIGWFCSYHFILYMNLVINVVFVVSVNFLAESPVFLVTKGRDKDALKSLKFYRGTSKSKAVLEELEYLKQQRLASTYSPAAKDEEVEKIKSNNEKKVDDDTEIPGREMTAWKILMTSKAVQRGVITITAQSVLSILMGLPALQASAGRFFTDTVPSLSPDLCSVVMAVAIAVGNALAVFITDLIPRRVLMLSSCGICLTCVGALCSMLRWSWAPPWAVALCTLVVFCAYPAGIGNISFVQLAESFAPKVKVLTSTIYMCAMFGCNFLVMSFFGLAVDNLGWDGVFFLVFLVTVAATVLAFFTMKETKGAPLEEIQGMHERGFLYWK